MKSFKWITTFKPMNFNKALNKQKAFTLIEVMAALAVFVLSATGLFTINQQTIQSSGQLENKTFAHWVALNTLNTIDAQGKFTEAGSQTIKENMAGVEWQAVVNIEETTVKNVFQVSVAVKGEDGQQHARVVGFSSIKKPIEF